MLRCLAIFCACQLGLLVNAYDEHPFPTDIAESACKILIRQTGKIVLPIEVNGSRIVGELDTGASTLVLHTDGMQQRIVGLRSSSRPILRFDGIIPTTIYHDFPILMQEGCKQLVDVSFADRSSLQDASGIPKDASIGVNCIRSYSLHVNLRSAEVSLEPIIPTVELTEWRRFDWKSEVPCVPISLPLLGMRSIFLDTGNNGWLSLNSNRIEQLLRAKHVAFLEVRPVLTPGGVITVKQYALRHVDFAGVRFHNVPVFASDVEAIGLGLLEHFDMTLDFPNSRASFVPLEIARDQMPVDASGLRVVFRESDRLMVRRIVPDSPAEKAGFKEGDRILNFAGREPATLWRHEIDETLAKAGETIHLRIERNGKPSEIDLPLSRPFQYPPEWPPEPPEFNPDAIPETPAEKDASSRP